jgi:hypothetical protein
MSALTFREAILERRGGGSADMFTAGLGMLYTGVAILSKERNLAPALLALSVVGIVVSLQEKR